MMNDDSFDSLSYDRLPLETRKFFRDLRQDDIADLSSAVDFMHSIQTVGRFTKWLLIGVFGVFFGAATFGDSVAKIVKFFHGGNGP